MSDFTIIGSGAGGSSAALELLKNGYSVQIIEEGIEYKNTKYSMLEGLMSLWRNNGINLFHGSPILNFGEGKCVGGSTVINGGVITQTEERVLDKWDKILNEKFFLSENFYKISDEIKDILVPKDQKFDKNLTSATSQILLNAAEKKNFFSKNTNLAFNNLNVKHNSPFGCSYGSKNSLDKNYHNLIKQLGGSILSNTKLIKIETNGSVIDKIIIENNTSKKKEEVKVKNLILSAGPIQTPKLILQNNLSNKVNDLSFHLNLKILCFYENETESYKSSLLTHHVRQFTDDGVLFMSSNYIKPLIASYLNFQNSNKIIELMENYKKGTVFNCQIQPNFSNAKIKKLKFLNDINISWALDNRDFLKIKKYLKILTELSFLSGAKEILLPIENKSILCNNIDQASQEINKLSKQNIEITSVHAMSSCSLSGTNNNIVDLFGKLRNFKNLYIMDASLLPTNTGQHPQLTIMALVNKLVKNNIESKKFNKFN